MPTSWDSSDSNSGPDGAGGRDLEEPVDAEVVGDVLTLDVGGVLEDDDLVYPVYIDPDWNAAGIVYWTIVESFPNTTYALRNGSALPVGYLNRRQAQATGGVDIEGALASSMSVLPLQGKQVIAAQFTNTEVWAFSCTPTPVELWRTSAPINATWNGTPSTSWLSHIETKTIAYGYNDVTCPDGRSNPAQLGWNVTSAVSSALSSGRLTLGMRASNEAANNQWKRFAQHATLVATYNTPPNAPTALNMTSPPRGCSTNAASPVFINGTYPFTLQANVTDTDPGNLSTRFYVWKKGTAGDGWQTGGQTAGRTTNALPSGPYPLGYAATPFQAQGAQSVVIPANTLPPGSYRWYSRTYDTQTSSTNLSAYCYFEVKNSAPTLPTYTPISITSNVIGQASTLKFNSSCRQDRSVRLLVGTNRGHEPDPTTTCGVGPDPARVRISRR